MVAAIGTGLTTSPNRNLVSAAPRLTVQALPGFGKTITLAWTGASLRPAHSGLPERGGARARDGRGDCSGGDAVLANAARPRLAVAV